MAEKSLKLTTKKPDGDANGLADPRVIKAVMSEPTRSFVAVVMFTVPVTERNNQSGDEIGKVELTWIEPVTDNEHGDAEQLRRTMTRMYERRTGATTLDVELEDALRDALGRAGVEDSTEI